MPAPRIARPLPARTKPTPEQRMVLAVRRFCVREDRFGTVESVHVASMSTIPDTRMTEVGACVTVRGVGGQPCKRLRHFLLTPATHSYAGFRVEEV